MVHTRDLQPRPSRWLVDTANRLSRVNIPNGMHTEYTYAYRYGSKLYSVTSNFPGEGNVTYETGGDGKRRSRVAGASETWYNYTVGFDVVSTEDDADGSTGALTMTNVVLAPMAAVSMTLGDLAGATPSSGTARYYATDHLGSTRSLWSSAKASVGAYEFDPYGTEYAHTGAALDTLAGAYTGKPWDATAQQFHFPYREYSPDMARWTTRDPLGMVDGPNVYGYASESPLNFVDLLGMTSECKNKLKQCMDSARRWLDGEKRRIRGTRIACHASISVACMVVCAPFVVAGGVGAIICFATCKTAQFAFCNLTASRALEAAEQQYGRKLDKCRGDFEKCCAEH